MVESCIRKIINEEYPIKQDMEVALQNISQTCSDEMTKFYRRPSKKILPEEWYTTNTDKKYGVIANKKLEFEGFPPIILKYTRNLFASGTYDEDNNEIWVFFDKPLHVTRIFEVLYHETIHYIDVVHNKMPVADKSKQFDKVNSLNIPYCFKYILYHLWDKFELRAHAYQYAKVGGYGHAMSMVNALYGQLQDCASFGNDSPVWETLSNVIWGGRKNKRNTRNKFINRTEHLIEKFDELIQKQFTDKDREEYNKRKAYYSSQYGYY